MKTAEDFVVDYTNRLITDFPTCSMIDLLRAYGAQVREEAAKIVDNTILSSREEMAAAIRKMELP